MEVALVGSADRQAAPTNILIATDLGSQSDRALDRAAQLARQWQATLHVVHALRPEATSVWLSNVEVEAAVGEDDHELVKRQVRRDLQSQVTRLDIHIRRGEPTNVILEVAEEQDCELIIVGVGGPAFSDMIFSTTDTQLLHRATRSVLLVKARPHGEYENIVIGTDFTEEAQRGLETAASWFDTAQFAVLHALDIPYQSLLLKSGRDREFIRMERETMETFIEQADLPEQVRPRMQMHVEHGYPETILSKYGSADGTTLTVLGTLRRSLAFRIFIGGDASRIVQTVPGDILIVR